MSKGSAHLLIDDLNTSYVAVTSRTNVSENKFDISALSARRFLKVQTVRRAVPFRLSESETQIHDLLLFCSKTCKGCFAQGCMCTAQCDAMESVTFAKDVIIYKTNSSIKDYYKCVYSSEENTAADQAGLWINWSRPSKVNLEFFRGTHEKKATVNKIPSFFSLLKPTIWRVDFLESSVEPASLGRCCP